MKNRYTGFPSDTRTTEIVDKFANRGNDTRQEDGVDENIDISIIKIDEQILKHLRDKIVPLNAQDGTSIEVPVVYANAERWKSIQVDGILRDKFDKLQLPLVTIRRTGMKVSTNNSPVNKYTTYTFKTQYNSRNIYDKFTALNGVKPSQKYYTVLIPDYFDFTYEGLIWTEYVEQMNTITEAISFESNEYWGERGWYRFRTEVGDFGQITDIPNSRNRMIRTKFSLTVHGYLLPEYALDRNGVKAPVTQVNFTPKKIVTFTELVGTGETYTSMDQIPHGEID
jgi:hypothetical protein